MLTESFISPGGVVFSFEISNTELGSKKIGEILQGIEGVTNVSVKRSFMAGNPVGTFCYKGANFLVWEPFGDSDRYWIGPATADGNGEVDISSIQNAFARAVPNRIRAFVARLFWGKAGKEVATDSQ